MLLLKVPGRESLAPLEAERLLALLPRLCDPVTVDNVAKELASARERGDEASEKAILERYERRRGDLSVFLKELKQRVSLFMNHRRLLYLDGAERQADEITGTGARRGFAIEESERVAEAPEGKALVPLPEMLKC